MDVARSALQTLQHTSALLDIYEYRIKMSVQKKTSVEPVPPETPQLLPTVHALWSPLVQSLKVPAKIKQAAVSVTSVTRWQVPVQLCPSVTGLSAQIDPLLVKLSQD